MADLYGWELLCMASADAMNSKENAMIGLLHWTVTKSGYRCIGLGTNKEFDSAAYGSEALPSGWNLTNGDCTLKYILKEELYVLRIIRSDDDCLVVNFMRSRDKDVACVLFNVEESIAAVRGTLEEMVPTYKTVVETIRRQLIAPFAQSSAQHVETQTPGDQSHTVPGHEDDLLRGMRSARDWDPNASRPLGNIGRNDLDPLGGFGHGGGIHGGGMIFNPFGEGRRNIRDPGLGIPGGILPRGSVPPGARFDPFSPLGGLGGLGGRPMPNPDHLPPPGYGDMFM